MQALALRFGLGAGGLLLGPARAQGLFQQRARLVVGVGKTHHQPVARPLGGQRKVAIEAVVQVLVLAVRYPPRQERVAVKAEHPRRFSRRKQGQK